MRGEPFFRDDWYEIFKLADQHYFNYFVNTNGTLIDENTAKKLKNTNIDKVCVSLDGSDSRIHDKSRGKIGTFDLTIRGINNLVKEEIFVDGIITLTKYNQEDIFNIINLMTELGVSEIAIMLLSTVGSAGKSKDSCYLSYEELKKWLLG
ncbi:MAG: radical SAM protein [Mediterraneibacter gnavus]